ncbi:DUF6602 domain-containing protein [uncultured Brevundimonas sp.]|uniref:DUF6602 domain-containing protein n=1 Tax=uncultured Brevundimonas sp. TaxID=213418 RepID=UPI0025DA4405|nr:DUF6602 domain-containing protein [uncultured Brevundimonas sp.]
MPKRSTRRPSDIFRQVLDQAESQLALDASKATNFDHRGLKGNERAAALAAFLTLHLPSVFAVGKGEALDFKDRRTGELDLLIYDRSSAAPIHTGSENVLVPAEALYAVIEVKSVLSAAELETCMAAAKKVRDLRPFKEAFVPAATEGRSQKGRCRCPYIVFAYGSNLGAENWAQKEYARIVEAARKSACDADVIDRVVVLDRGIINPQTATALLKDEASGLFLEFYLHLINFLTREKKRRAPIDWTAYTGRSTWVQLS